MNLSPVAKFKSDYLCDTCGSVLYCRIDDIAADLCLNPSCQKFDHSISIVDTNKGSAPELHKELEAEEARLISTIESCDHGALALYVYNLRLSLIESAITNRVMPSIPTWLAIGDLLILMNIHTPKGHDSTGSTFDQIIKLSCQRNEHLNFIEDVQNGRFRIVKLHSGQTEVLKMKYLSPITAMLKVYGIASSNDPDSPDLFQFQDIDELVISDIDLKTGVDLSEYFRTLLPYVTTLRYAFGLHYRTSIQYRYQPTLVDIPFLLGVCFNLKSKTPMMLSNDNLRRYFTKYQQYAAGRTIEGLLGEYANSNNLVPLMVPVNDRVIVDPLTLLYFIMHLYGQEICNGGGGKARDVALMKKKAADSFEEKVRVELRKHGYTCPVSAVKVKYEYDVLGICEDKNRILVIDAKFRDISPSSISAFTLVDQELMEPEVGLCVEVNTHRTRVDCSAPH